MKWAEILAVAIKVAPAIQQMSAELRKLGAKQPDSQGGKRITGEEAAYIAQIVARTVGSIVDDILAELGIKVDGDE